MLEDFNINILDDKEVCSLHRLKQIITSYSRVTENTSTLIDHALTNSVDKVSQFCVHKIARLDHPAIFCTRKTLKQRVS